MLPQVLLVVVVVAYGSADAAVASGSLGVNYGRVANNLPSVEQVVRLLQSTSISKVKLFDADPTVLQAFAAEAPRGRFQLTIGLPNEDIPTAAMSSSFAARWVDTAVTPFAPWLVRAVAVGNEVVNASATPTARLLVGAMQNIQAALAARGLGGAVKLSSPLPLGVLSRSYPPSAGAFYESVTPVVKPLLDFLSSTGSYLMVNAYPYFAVQANPLDVPLDYALFRPNAGVYDPANGLHYNNLLDAQLDAVAAATAALGHPGLPLVVSETGWPSAGDVTGTASVANAAAYNRGLLAWLSRGGTPLRPSAAVDAFIFALFDENLKPGPATERHYGLFHPDRTRSYDCGIVANVGGSIGAVRSAKGDGRRKQQHHQPHQHGKQTSKGQQWCVAKPGISEAALQNGLDYACGEGGADCKPIQAGQPCFLPNSLTVHASYAFNSYYQRKASIGGTCDFGGAAVLTNSDPSHDGCSFPLL